MNYEQIRAMVIQHEDMCLTHEYNEAGYKDKKQSREELIAYVLSLQERNEELLEALKILYRNFRSQHAHLLILGAPDFVRMDKVAEEAITKAEAAE